MATLAISAVGGAVGSLFGVSSLGFLAGSVIGGVFFNDQDDQRIEGPRLGDLSVTASTYGLPIPLGYGTVAISGNMIWSSGIEERQNSRDIDGGKGGLGGPQQTQVSFTYFSNFAIAFASTEAEDVLRIWADSKLIFDKTGQNIVRKEGLSFRFYKGDEEQLPDSLIESFEGVGQVPAHRGLVYIVFDDLPLGDFGNRVPNITAEIAFKSDTADSAALSIDLDPNIGFDNTAMSVDYLRQRLYIITGDIRYYNLNDLVEFRRVDNGGFFPLNGNAWHAGRFTGFIYTPRGNDNAAPITKHDPDTYQVLGQFGTFGFLTGNRVDGFGNSKLLVEGQSYTSLGGLRTFLAQAATFNDIGLLDADSMTFLFKEDNSVLVGGITGINTLTRQQQGECNFWYVAHAGGDTNVQILKMSIAANAFYDTDAEVTTGVTFEEAVQLDSSVWGGSGFQTVVGPAIDMSDQALIFVINVSGGCQVFKWDEDEGVVWSTFVSGQGRPRQGSLWALNSQVDNNRVGWTDNIGRGCIINTGDGTVIVSGVDVDALGVTSAGCVFWHTDTEGIVQHNTSSGAGTNDISRVFLNRATGAAVPLAGIFEDLCERADFDPDTDVNTTEITDLCKGFTNGRQTSFRSILDPLLTAFLVEVVESDDQIKFTKRGKDPVATIPQRRLAILDERGEVIPETRIQEVDLPTRISVRYLDQDNDYEQGTQSFRRILAPFPVVHSRSEQSVDLPIVFNPTEAEQLAERLLISTWNERSTRKWRAAQRYLALEPTDVVNIELDSGTILPARVSKTSVSPGFLIEFEGVNESKTTFSSDATADGGLGVPPPRIPPPANTQTFILNINLLRDIDDLARIASRQYFAMSGYVEGWNGGNLLQSLGGNDVYTQIARSLGAAAWGTVVDALEAPAEPFVYDEDSVLQVYMQVGELESVTELEWLNDANTALVGDPNTGNWEIIGFRDVTEISPGLYEITGFLRGKRGTEVFSDSHAIGEKFIVMDRSSIFAYTLDLNRLNQFISYKGVGFAEIQENAPAIFLSSDGADLKPYAPAQLDAVVDGGSNIDFSWERRTRVGGSLKDGTGTVPLSEDSESYEVDVKDGPGGTVLRTLPSSTTTVQYDNADIITDFGSVPSSITFEVFQLSAQVGRGYGSEATIEL